MIWFPGTIVVTPESFVIARSACGVSVTVSSSELLLEFVSDVELTLAVFTRSPVALDEIVAVNVYVIEPLFGMVTVSEMSPVPELVNVVAVELVAVQVAPDRVRGKVDRKSTRLNSSHVSESRMPSSA